MSTTAVEPEQMAAVAATRVRMVTVERGWTQKELALATGIAPATVSIRWRGRQAWPLVDLARVARALDVEVADLLDAEGLRLPRLDSNQQPSGYTNPLVSAGMVVYQCQQCGWCFDTAREWRAHRDSVHAATPVSDAVTCTECGGDMAWSAALDCWVCDWCGVAAESAGLGTRDLWAVAA